MDNPYSFLNKKFLEAMNDISRHGFEKHGENSFEAKRRRGDLTRSDKRHETEEIQFHAREHFSDYAHGIQHDHFHTLVHQLAASAINCMIEAEFAGLVPQNPPQTIWDRQNDPELDPLSQIEL
jgi:hypothetical protein